MSRSPDGKTASRFVRECSLVVPLDSNGMARAVVSCDSNCVWSVEIYLAPGCVPVNGLELTGFRSRRGAYNALRDEAARCPEIYGYQDIDTEIDEASARPLPCYETMLKRNGLL